jgi:hypothetical protein
MTAAPLSTMGAMMVDGCRDLVAVDLVANEQQGHEESADREAAIENEGPGYPQSMRGQDPVTAENDTKI